MTTSTPFEPPAKHMGWVPEGEFMMGSDDFYPEETPARGVAVDGFWIDEHPVTVAEFRRFVKATGHRTTAEVAPDAVDYPDADPRLLVPGSLVFQPSRGPVDLRDFSRWWAWTPGAFWRRPEGPGSNVGGRELHPVLHVSYGDALAYARWIGKDLPTEAEWERAARGGLEGKVFAWGDEFAPKGRMMANTWQGEFPWQNLLTDGFGLYDMTGNTWEWTSDWFSTGAAAAPGQPSCCAPRNPRVGSEAGSYGPGERIPRKVIKGGSHLCAPNYCLRYRPAARQSEAIDTSTSHIGFRCVIRPGHDLAPAA